MLQGRFGERDENVKIEIFKTFQSLVIASLRIDRISGGNDGSTTLPDLDSSLALRHRVSYVQNMKMKKQASYTETIGEIYPDIINGLLKEH